MMTDYETMVLSSLQVYLFKPDDPNPQGFGTGFILRYLERRFFVSVSHVTDYDGQTTYLETNIFDQNQKKFLLVPISGICHFDLMQINPDGFPEDFVKFLEEGERKRLDICFAEIKSDITLLQPELAFPSFVIPRCQKIELDMEYIAEPSKEEVYGFFGRIKPKYLNGVLTLTPTLKHGLKYRRTNKDFHIFLAPRIIVDPEDYAGCSGAPILDSDQLLVGIACVVATPSTMIYAFPISKCKELLDTALATGMFN
jgi:hypothetical protein